jgi:hypothetical protein
VFDLFMPSTDTGVIVQFALTVLIGTPLVVMLYRRKATELVWFVGGLELLLLALYFFRTVH